VTRLGVIGAGHFAAYFIAALRHGGYEGEIFLSPRNAGIATELKRDCQCHVANSNTDVLEHAGVILLSVRPQHAAEALQPLRFGREHTVLSAMAGIPVGRVRELIPGVGAIHRIMPSSFIEAVRGPIPLYPAAPALMSFLAFAGEVVTLPSEHAFEMAMISACFSTWVYDLAQAVADELSRHGLDPTSARALTLGNIAGPAGLALANPLVPLAAISASIATEGTFTKIGLEHLKSRGFDGPWRESIAMLSAKLRETI
jgi:pyrroline-5-carboxylate reductase